MKAFLCHSSKDKPLVDAVAKQLGRQFCLYDRYSFETGEEFTDAIRRCLDQAAVFVLFASKESLKSIWVKLELEEAWQRKLRESIKRSLVYIVDDGISVESIPEWLQRALVTKNNAARSISQDIRLHLDRLLRERRQPYFFGRGADLGRFEELLTPTDGSSVPRVFVVWGLPGIGRRTLIKHGASNLLSLAKHVEIRLAEGDSTNDVCAKVADLAESFTTADEFKAVFYEIQELPRDQALTRTIRNLRTLVDSGELPVFVDEGGFLDSEGYIRDPAIDILKSVDPRDTVYLAFVSDRKPQLRMDVTVPLLQLKPLLKEDTQRLLQRLAMDREVAASSNELEEIAEYVAGYPPSAYFAIQQAKDYGVQLVVNHKRRLVEFRTGVFLRHIEGLSLDPQQGAALKLLASYSPLPLSVVLAHLKADLETTVNILTRLIDLSLVIVDGDGLYRISDPIAEAASNTFGLPSRGDAKTVATALTSYLATATMHHRYLDLSRVLFRAARLSGEKTLESTTVRLASDLIRLTEEHYHARQYDQSVDCGKLAIAERPDTINGRGYLIRALIQLERWSEAEDQLRELSRFAPLRDVHFLKGFLERRRGNYQAAIIEFEEAIRRGRRGAAVSREISQCYYLIGNFEAARAHLQNALANHGDNRYIVDLWTQLATDLGDEEEARKALARLEVIDRPVYFQFRKSRVNLRFGKPVEAREAVQAALEVENHPPFAVVAQAVLCELALGRLKDAATFLEKLDRDFRDVKRDIRTGLHCRLELAKGNYGDALRMSDGFTNMQSRYHQLIRYEALEKVLKDPTLESSTSKRYKEEYQSLATVLKGNLRFDIPELDASFI